MASDEAAEHHDRGREGERRDAPALDVALRESDVQRRQLHDAAARSEAAVTRLRLKRKRGAIRADGLDGAGRGAAAARTKATASGAPWAAAAAVAAASGPRRQHEVYGEVRALFDRRRRGGLL